jgi:hypothetical protein
MSDSVHVTQVPRSGEQRSDLIAQQPFAWEYRLFAGVLLDGREYLDWKWRDHVLRFAPGQRRSMNSVDALAYLDGKWDSAASLCRGVEILLSTEATEMAFGRPGEVGNADLIEHLGRRIIGVYEGLIDWSSDLRTIATADELVEVFELAARSTDRPLSDIRGFIEHLVGEMEELPSRLAGNEGRSISIEVSLIVHGDDELIETYRKKLKSARKKLGLW